MVKKILCCPNVISIITGDALKHFAVLHKKNTFADTKATAASQFKLTRRKTQKSLLRRKSIKIKQHLDCDNEIVAIKENTNTDLTKDRKYLLGL